MTYQVNGKIEDTDFNSLANSVNEIWGSGAGNSGYGQSSTIPTVSNLELITATSYWTALTNRITTIANHQGSIIGTMVPQPVTNAKITFLQNILNNITTIQTRKLSANAQGSTSSTNNTSASTFNAKMIMNFSVNFSSENAARYFFNAGGQLGLNFSHPNSGGINTIFSDICSETGTIWLSSPTSDTISLSSLVYAGVTKIGGVASTRSSINSNYGFYALNATPTQIYSQRANIGGAYYNVSNLKILASTISEGSIKKVNFACEFDVVPNGTTVSAGTVATLTIRPPSTTYLTNTWGTPTVTTSISHDTVNPITFGSVGSFSYTVPSGSSQIQVTYPTTSGVANTIVNVTPNQTYTVTIGDYGAGSSISGVFSTTPYNYQVLGFNGIVDSYVYIYQRVIGSTLANYSSNGAQYSKEELNQFAANAGIYYVEGSEANHGDYPAAISCTQVPISQILFAYRCVISYYGGRGGGAAFANISNQPTAANGYVMTIYIQDGFNGAAWSPINVSLEQIVGLTILPL